MSKLKTLSAKNFGKHSEITVNFPESGLIVFTGENSAGKTTMLQMILSLYCGASERYNDLIKQGEKSGEVEVTEVDNDGIERTIKLYMRQKSYRVEVTTQTDTTRAITETELKKRWNDITFYPLRFIAASDKDQIDMIGKATKYSITDEQSRLLEAKALVFEMPNPADSHEPLVSLRQLIRTYENTRRLEGQRRTQAEKDLAQYVDVPDEVDESELASIPVLQQQLSLAEQQNVEYIRISTLYEARNKRVVELEEELLRAKAERVEAKAQLDAVTQIDVEPMRFALAEMQKKQQLKQTITLKAETAARVNECNNKYEQYTSDLEALRTVSETIKASAGLPDGLEIKDGKVVLDGKPFKSEGLARQFITAVKIGILGKPQLQAILLDEVSVMTDADESKINLRAELDELAKLHGFQVFGTAPTSKTGHVIEIR